MIWDVLALVGIALMIASAVLFAAAAIVPSYVRDVRSGRFR